MREISVTLVVCGSGAPVCIIFYVMYDLFMETSLFTLIQHLLKRHILVNMVSSLVHIQAYIQDDLRNTEYKTQDIQVSSYSQVSLTFRS